MLIIQRMSPRIVLIAVLALYLFGGSTLAQAPVGYYDGVSTSTPTELRATLHDVIDDHVRHPYTSSATDTWDILESADEDPLDSGRILDVYRNASYAKVGGGNTDYNREHTWPNSYGFPDDNSQNYPYSDCHALFLCDSSYNSSRSNKPFRSCDSGCSEKSTEENFGQGGGTGVYPGNSNWTSGSGSSGAWETWSARRGDVARALFYLDLRYEGGMHGTTGTLEPDLVLTDDEALIAASNTGSNESVAYMGMLTVLLQWHLEDPVDSLELWRNDVVYSFQGNRNPFIDHPEWVACLFSGDCGSSTPPSAPGGLEAFEGEELVDLDWSDNLEEDLAGYDVHRSETSGGPYTQLNVGLVTESAYSDTTVAGGVTYFYVVTASDTGGDESDPSVEVAATPTGGSSPTDPWINELHYDNSGGDKNEFVEVAGPAGLDLSGWELLGYNGSGGDVYGSKSLSGVLPDQGGCIGTTKVKFRGLQNGSPDGIALVDPSGVVVEFLSYEGTFTAQSGPASGLTSVDIGVSESSSTPVGDSLQRGGVGSGPADFFWQAAQVDTPGQPNTGQTFTGGCGGPSPPPAPTGLSAVAGDGHVDLAWDPSGSPDVVGHNLYRSVTSGSGYVVLNSTPLTGTAYADAGLVNGTEYYYVLTAVDSSSLESATSAEVSATPQDATAPAPPSGLVAVPGDGSVSLDWSDNDEPDLVGYNVHRATTSGGAYTQVNAGPLVTSELVDSGVVGGTTYYYVVTAQDLSGNQSAPSLEVSATPTGSPPAADPWINELHYSDAGKDEGEFVELAGPAGLDLSGWSVSCYNGNNGNVYATIDLSGILPDQQAGFGALSFARTLRNAGGSALALVDPGGSVVQFLSYGGVLTASSGPASGMTSTDIGVAESSSTSAGDSLQLGGSGSASSDFTWQPPQADTPGAPNAGQTFVGD